MPELTITAIARKAGVRPSTLRCYEKRASQTGIVAKPCCTSSRNRN
jgi:DNA-binding transcriptional MerR regulator